MIIPNAARRVAANTAWQLLAYFVGLAASLAGVALLTRYLGERGFGEYITIITAGFLLAALSDFGLASLMSRELARQGLERGRLYWNALGLRAAASLGICVVVLLTMPFLPYSRMVRVGIGLFSLTAVLVSLGSLISANLQAGLVMGRTAAGEIANRLAGLGVTFWVVTTHQPLLHLLVGLMGAQALQFVILVVTGRSLLPFRLHFDFPVWRALVQKSAPFATMAVLAVVYARADMLILSAVYNPSLTPDVGIYGAAYRVLDALLVLPVALLRSVFPLLVPAVGRNTIMGRVPQDAFRGLTILASPILLGGIYLARPLMEIVAGGKFVQPQLLLIPGWGAALFSPSPVALQILLVAFFFMAFGFLNGLLLIALEHQDTLLRIFVVVVPLNVFLSLALIPKYSFVGAAMATAASEIVGFVLSSRAVRRIGIAYPWGSLARPLLAAGGMAAVFAIVRGTAPNVMVLIALGAGTYGLLLLLLSDVETARLFRLLLRRAPRRTA